MAPGGRSIPYSEFKTLLKDNKVADVTISDQTIRGTLKDGGEDQKSPQFTTTRVDDPKLTEELASEPTICSSASQAHLPLLCHFYKR